MKTWQYIGWCIRTIYELHQFDEDVIMCKYYRTQMQTVRKYGTDYQEECHSSNEELG